MSKMTVEQMQERAEALRAESSDLYGRADTLSKRAHELAEKAQALTDKILDLAPFDMEDDEQYVALARTPGMKAYYRLGEHFEKFFDGLPVFRSGSLWPTRIPAVTLTLTYREVPEPLAERLVQWLTRVKRITPLFPEPEEISETKKYRNRVHEDGFVFVDILEHSASEDGVWWTEINPDVKMARVLRLRYGSLSVQFAGTLDEALDWVAEHAWYKGGPGEDGLDWED